MNHKLDFPSEIKAEGSTGRIFGLASTWGNKDLYGDVVEPGAFAESIKAIQRGERQIALLDHHRMDSPIGVWESLKETDRGLEVEGKLVMSVARAREVNDLIVAGAIKGLSIGFRVIEDEMDRESRSRRLKQVDLMEISTVSLPANPKAQIEAIKSSMTAPEIRNKREFEAALVECLGFSRNAAKSICARGFDPDLREEAGSSDVSDLREAVEAIKRSANLAIR